MPWRLASAWGDSPPRNSWTTCRLNSIECVRCLAMGFLLESPVQLADSQVPYLSTPRGALQPAHKFVEELLAWKCRTKCIGATSTTGPEGSQAPRWGTSEPENGASRKISFASSSSKRCRTVTKCWYGGRGGDCNVKEPSR